MPNSNVRSLRDERRAHDLVRRRADALAARTPVFAGKGFDDAQITDISAAVEWAPIPKRSRSL